MGKNTIIKGRPVYLYKKAQYIDKPAGTFIKRIKYDEESNRSYVYCGKRSVIVEVLCSIVIIACVVANLFFTKSYHALIRYNSVAYYYDDKLYINMLNESENRYDITATFYDAGEVVTSFVLSPGQYMTAIGIEDPKSSYTVEVTCKTPLKTYKESTLISVVIRE